MEHLNYIYNSFINIFNYNEFIKTSILLFITFIFIKYFKKHTIKLITFLGEKFISINYLKSFFYNKKIVKIAFYFIPLLFLNYFVFYHSLDNSGKTTMQTLSNILYIFNYVFVTIWLSNFLSHTIYYLNNNEKYRNKPLHSFAQIAFIIFLIISIATIYAHYTNQSPKTLFTTLSVMSVAVFLTLKDIILGIISTILIITNNIVNVGDWIKNDKYHADGNIIEINLITVKVLNFDKTIVVIPTYSLISEGFQNQQEIINSGKRRIKRSIMINPKTVKYISSEELEKYKKIDCLKDYIEKRLEEFNKNKKDDDFVLNGLNNKNFTNLGLFRKYIQKYLENHPMIFNGKIKKKLKNDIESENNKEIPLYNRVNKKLCFEENYDIIVRSIEGTKEGLGLEIYCFSNNSEWENYEYLISTIMEHIYASGQFFDLEINC